MPELAKGLRLAERRPLSEAERGQLQILSLSADNEADQSQSELAATDEWQRFLAAVRLSTELSAV